MRNSCRPAGRLAPANLLHPSGHTQLGRSLQQQAWQLFEGRREAAKSRKPAGSRQLDVAADAAAAAAAAGVATPAGRPARSWRYCSFARPARRPTGAKKAKSRTQAKVEAEVEVKLTISVYPVACSIRRDHLRAALANSFKPDPAAKSRAQEAGNQLVKLIWLGFQQVTRTSAGATKHFGEEKRSERLFKVEPQNCCKPPARR